MRCNIFHHIIGNVERFTLCLLAQNSDTSLQLGRLNIGNQTPLKARTHTFSKPGELFWRQVGGNHNLLLVIMQGVESMEELFLCMLFTRQKLDIVDQKHIDIAVNLFER